MEPVVGLDVSKGTSVFQAFLKRNEAFGKMEMIPNAGEIQLLANLRGQSLA